MNYNQIAESVQRLKEISKEFQIPIYTSRQKPETISFEFNPPVDICLGINQTFHGENSYVACLKNKEL